MTFSCRSREGRKEERGSLSLFWPFLPLSPWSERALWGESSFRHRQNCKGGGGVQSAVKGKNPKNRKAAGGGGGNSRMHCGGEEWMGRGEKRDRSLGNEKEEEKLEKGRGEESETRRESGTRLSESGEGEKCCRAFGFNRKERKEGAECAKGYSSAFSAPSAVDTIPEYPRLSIKHSSPSVVRGVRPRRRTG